MRYLKGALPLPPLQSLLSPGKPARKQKLPTSFQGPPRPSSREAPARFASLPLLELLLAATSRRPTCGHGRSPTRAVIREEHTGTGGFPGAAAFSTALPQQQGTCRHGRILRRCFLYASQQPSQRPSRDCLHARTQGAGQRCRVKHHSAMSFSLHCGSQREYNIVLLDNPSAGRRGTQMVRRQRVGNAHG